jgi:hypothetical protein
MSSLAVCGARWARMLMLDAYTQVLEVDTSDIGSEEPWRRRLAKSEDDA